MAHQTMVSLSDLPLFTLPSDDGLAVRLASLHLAAVAAAWARVVMAGRKVARDGLDRYLVVLMHVVAAVVLRSLPVPPAAPHPAQHRPP